MTSYCAELDEIDWAVIRHALRCYRQRATLQEKAASTENARKAWGNGKLNAESVLKKLDAVQMKLPF